jgi:hypothetical protein
LLRTAATFHLVLIGWFLFRIGQIGDVEALWATQAVVLVRDAGALYNMLAYLLVFVCAHALRYMTGLRIVAHGRPLVLQALVISGAVALMVVLGARASKFIYFQF